MTDKKNANLDIRLKIKNFALVENADISIKNFTLLVGPNNSGKSYLAMLLYSIEQLLGLLLDQLIPTDTLDENNILYPLRNQVWSYKQELAVLGKALVNQDKSSQIETLANESPNFFRNGIEDCISGFLRDYLPELLEGTFGCPVKDLVRANKRTATVTYVRNSKLGLQIKINRDGSFDTTAELLQAPALFFQNTEEQFFQRFIASRTKIFDPANPAVFFVTLFNHWLWAYLDDTKSFDNHHYYLPASRSGFVLSQKALFHSLIESTKFSSSPGTSSRLPSLPGPVADFLREITALDENRWHRGGPKTNGTKDYEHYFKEELDLFEKELFKGFLEVEYPMKSKSAFPEFHFHEKSTGNRVPIFRASSGVTELLPFFLYVKHKIGPGDLLIIEEPEAHLHPELQFQLIRLFVRLVRKGVHIIITTHSDFILSSINVFLKARLKNLEAPELEKLGIDSEKEPLDKNALSVVTLDQQGAARNLDIEDEIPDTEFYRVVETLYNLTAALDNAPSTGK